MKEENNDFDVTSPKNMLMWFGEETVENYRKMKSNRVKSEVRQRLLNSVLDSWSKGYKLLNEAETVENLRSRIEALETLEDEKGIRAVK
ncbi:MAG: hypothetical protein K9L57_09650 [Spirochaetaceae bacterium]|nr:hypothetical protein [Spirochaetia bacterium]MCF7951885.1 hypothetical protein [Spirochaetaceae bacterium]